MKIAELEGALLDYWVALALGFDAVITRRKCYRVTRYNHGVERVIRVSFAPSTEWSQGGPIIGCERITFIRRGQHFGAMLPARDDSCPGDGHTWPIYGETHLIAAMRAYVASKYGEEVPDAPEVKV